MFWDKWKEDREKLEELEMKYAELLEKKESAREPVTRDFQERITELEVKMAKLWALLVTVDKRTEKEKASPTGRKIYGGRLN